MKHREITGSLAERNGRYTAILNLYDEDGKRRQKSIALGIPVKGNKRKAQAQLEELWRAAAEALLVQQGKARPDPACAEAALLLADKLTARQLLGLCAACQRFAEQCDQNAGVGQILGALAVKWEELL